MRYVAYILVLLDDGLGVGDGVAAIGMRHCRLHGLSVTLL